MSFSLSSPSLPYPLTTTMKMQFISVTTEDSFGPFLISTLSPRLEPVF